MTIPAVSYVRSLKRARIYRVLSLQDRFWNKVQKTDGCWVWTGSRDDKGYGQIREGGRGTLLLKAHRVSWMLAHGSLPDLLILHRCDNPPCVRPDHLRAGTHAENSQDAAQKGRLVFQKHPELAPRGERASGAKLTAAQVEEVRRLRAEGWSQTRLARHFGVSQAAIWYLLSGRTWKAQP